MKIDQGVRFTFQKVHQSQMKYDKGFVEDVMVLAVLQRGFVICFPLYSSKVSLFEG